MKESKSNLSKVLMYGGSFMVFAVIIGLIVWLILSLDSPQQPKKNKIQQITVIAPPPPPPPPPEVEEPPPPEVEEVEVEEPEPTPEDVPDLPPDEAPPGEQLGLDADGTGAGDAFGLVGRKGGRGLLSGGDPFAWYSNILQETLLEKFNERRSIRRSSYSIEVLFWVDLEGNVERAELGKSSGDPVLDEKIKEAILSIKKLEPPVREMPMPVKIRLSARM